MRVVFEHALVAGKTLLCQLASVFQIVGWPCEASAWTTLRSKTSENVLMDSVEFDCSCHGDCAAPPIDVQLG